ncbi:MAG TPA: hypothetical protein VIO11_06500 [Candidatus Methanoperedens sp.]
MNRNLEKINDKFKSFILIGIMASLFFSGCISSSEEKQTEQTPKIASTTSTISSTMPSPTTEISQSDEQNKIKELEDKINSMQVQITDMQTRLDRIGLPKPSTKSLIPPQLPFKIEFQWSEMQVPLQYVFKESEVEIIDSYGDKDTASFIMDRKNNTIKINSKKYDYYGIVLYDDFATAIYENGWIAWGKKYKITQKYNPVTQRFEI